MKNESLKVDSNGGVIHTPIFTEYERASQLDEIIRLIKDSNEPLSPIKRMIAGEIATTTRQMVSYSDEMSLLDGMKVKALESQVKALRELGKELMESDVLSKKDFLNFDGPKLTFVLGEYRQGAEDTLKKIGIDDSTTQQFLRQWRDLMMEREASIRKMVEKVDLETEKKQ